MKLFGIPVLIALAFFVLGSVAATRFGVKVPVIGG